MEKPPVGVLGTDGMVAHARWSRIVRDLDQHVAQTLRQLVIDVPGDPDVLAVVLFGSRAREEAGAGSDVDVCLVREPRPRPSIEASRKRLDHLGPADLDVVVFEQLPLHVRRRVLKEGRVLFLRDEERLYVSSIIKAATRTRSRVVDRERVLARRTSAPSNERSSPSSGRRRPNESRQIG
jgi:predicted nucleotidyltransferase